MNLHKKTTFIDLGADFSLPVFDVQTRRQTAHLDTHTDLTKEGTSGHCVLKIRTYLQIYDDYQNI